ncbi:MAG: FAD-dependent oxidoreductase, partial [Polyangia bacterium]
FTASAEESMALNQIWSGAIIDRRLALLEAEGVRFVTGAHVGKSPSWSALRKEHDAVVLAIGAARPRLLDVPGADLSGVVLAMPYLEAQNRATVPAALDARGRRVLILGGGDTGSDCLGTAHRQGASAVSQVELLAAPPPTRDSSNPWPQWPMVFRTSTSHEEGGARLFARRTTRLEGEHGQLVALHWIETVQKDGRVVDVPGTEQRIELDLLVLALGFVGPDPGTLPDELGVRLDPRGNIIVDAQRQTSAPGVFCAGDASRGASLIVWAISDGREAAHHVDASLRGGPSALPTRGLHLPFGGRS